MRKLLPYGIRGYNNMDDRYPPQTFMSTLFLAAHHNPWLSRIPYRKPGTLVMIDIRFVCLFSPVGEFVSSISRRRTKLQHLNTFCSYPEVVNIQLVDTLFHELECRKEDG